MTEEKKNTHGGARPGAGRPKGIYKPNKPPEEKTENHTIRLNKSDWLIYKTNGGTKTLRYLIKNNKFKRD